MRLPPLPDYGTLIGRSDQTFTPPELRTLIEQLRALSLMAPVTVSHYLKHPSAAAKATSLLPGVERTAAELGSVLKSLARLEPEWNEMSRRDSVGAALCDRQTKYVTSLYALLLDAVNSTG